MRYLIALLLFSLNLNANTLEIGLGTNVPNAINESYDFNYRLSYNYDLYRGDLDVGTSLSYEYYQSLAQTIDIKGRMTQVSAHSGKLGFYVNEEVLALARVQYEAGLSYFELSKSNITPTGGTLYGVYSGIGVLFTNNSITTKFSYTFDYAKNRSDDFGVNTMFMNSFKIGVMFEL